MIKIAIIGGPCSGKTTTINKLLKTIPYTYTVREVARELIDMGIKPEEHMHIFQRELLKYQIAKENAIINIIESNGNGKEILLVDRGVFDVFAYLPKEERNTIIEELNINKAYLENRYNAVIYLETTDKSNYINDFARQESYELACELGVNILNIYNEHNYKPIIIKATNNISEKISEVEYSIKQILKMQNDS